jgi:hypothetical protein
MIPLASAAMRKHQVWCERWPSRKRRRLFPFAFSRVCSSNQSRYSRPRSSLIYPVGETAHLESVNTVFDSCVRDLPRFERIDFLPFLAHLFG